MRESPGYPPPDRKKLLSTRIKYTKITHRMDVAKDSPTLPKDNVYTRSNIYEEVNKCFEGSNLNQPFTEGSFRRKEDHSSTGNDDPKMDASFGWKSLDHKKTVDHRKIKQELDRMKDVVARYHLYFHEQKQETRNISQELIATRSQMQIYMEEINSFQEEIISLKKHRERLHDAIIMLQNECFHLLPTNTRTWKCRFCGENISISLITWHLASCGEDKKSFKMLK